MIRNRLIWLLETATKALQGRTNKASSNAPKIKGDHTYPTEVTGESHYQIALRKISGPKGLEAKRFECLARITPEPDNPWDKNACAVFINDMKVGYLPAIICQDYIKQLKQNGFKKTDSLSVDAIIVGGWKDDHNEGHYGVKLDLPWIE